MTTKIKAKQITINIPVSMELKKKLTKEADKLGLNLASYCRIKLIEQSQDELDFLYSIGEDYHLWDVNEQGKYPIERLLSAVSKRINKLKSKFHITLKS